MKQHLLAYWPSYCLALYATKKQEIDENMPLSLFLIDFVVKFTCIHRKKILHTVSAASSPANHEFYTHCWISNAKILNTLLKMTKQPRKHLFPISNGVGLVSFLCSGAHPLVILCLPCWCRKCRNAALDGAQEEKRRISHQRLADLAVAQPQTRCVCGGSVHLYVCMAEGAV